MSEGGKLESRNKKAVEELDEELAIWHRHGIDPSNITINAFLMDMQITTLIQFLVEKGILENRDELDLEYRLRTLARMRELRPAIIEHRNKALQSQKILRPPIMGPNGRPL